MVRCRQLAALKKKEAKQRAKDRRRRDQEKEERDRGVQHSQQPTAGQHEDKAAAFDDAAPSGWDTDDAVTQFGGTGGDADGDAEDDDNRRVLEYAQRKALSVSAEWVGQAAASQPASVGQQREKRIGSGSWRGGWASARIAAQAGEKLVARHVGPANASERRVNAGPVHKKVLATAVVTLGGGLF